MDYLNSLLGALGQVDHMLILSGEWGADKARCEEKKEEEKRVSNIAVSYDRINHLMETAEVEVMTVFDKCTIVVAKLENGFILTESSACVDPANYDPELGEDICRAKIKERLWELEGYALQKAVHKLTQEV